ncbi:yaiA2 [Candidatus Sodalis pierantonius str. SOPE]|uniref:YaiA2 n=1 Tax=Candidatus Sodalis pierantonii str. SOPE TaxID=2342 RepID=W0HR47_9GAMM|nr:yaiA2 [Candidatus Sodalis pierantonius str. SOPE]
MSCVPTIPIPIPLSVNTTLSKKRWIPKSAMRMKTKADLPAAGPRVLPFLHAFHRCASRFVTSSA